MKAFLGIVMTAALISPTLAAPTIAPPTSNASSIILVEGGCGRDYHRDDRGLCRPNWREWDHRACPPGWHLGPERRRCWPN
ncbi:MAG: hypothetical protein ABSE20_18025 [Acetobacteraceae bacterium]|jgi:hypothetical protein